MAATSPWPEKCGWKNQVENGDKPRKTKLEIKNYMQ
jgi:hypothetical protein